MIAGLPRRAASSAASFMTFARSAPAMPCVRRATTSRSASAASGLPAAWIARIARRARQVRRVDVHVTVEAPGPHERGIERVGPVRRRDHDDPGALAEAVELDEDLVERLVALAVVLAAAHGADGVDLVDEDDRRRDRARLGEQVAHARRALAGVALDEVRRRRPTRRRRSTRRRRRARAASCRRRAGPTAGSRAGCARPSRRSDPARRGTRGSPTAPRSPRRRRRRRRTSRGPRRACAGRPSARAATGGAGARAPRGCAVSACSRSSWAICSRPARTASRPGLVDDAREVGAGHADRLRRDRRRGRCPARAGGRARAPRGSRGGRARSGSSSADRAVEAARLAAAPGSSTSGRFVAPTTITPLIGEKPSISASSWFSAWLCSELGPGVDRVAAAAVLGERVELVDEDERGRVLARLAKQLAHARGADADVQLDEVRARDREERRARLARERARQQRLAAARRAEQQDRPWGSSRRSRRSARASRGTARPRAAPRRPRPGRRRRRTSCRSPAARCGARRCGSRRRRCRGAPTRGSTTSTSTTISDGTRNSAAGKISALAICWSIVVGTPASSSILRERLARPRVAAEVQRVVRVHRAVAAPVAADEDAVGIEDLAVEHAPVVERALQRATVSRSPSRCGRVSSSRPKNTASRTRIVARNQPPSGSRRRPSLALRRRAAAAARGEPGGGGLMVVLLMAFGGGCGSILRRRRPARARASASAMIPERADARRSRRARRVAPRGWAATAGRRAATNERLSRIPSPAMNAQRSHAAPAGT